MKKGSLSNENTVQAYLGLGSNVGARESNLREAIDRTSELGVRINRESSIYETEPVGFPDQGWFLNQVIGIEVPASFSTVLNDTKIQSTQVKALLRRLLDIENHMGRSRTIVNGPRTIDIDLLYFGDAIIGQLDDRAEELDSHSPALVVPHPRLHQRRFVLAPLCEIAPDLVHPVLKQTSCQMLASLDDHSVVRLYKSASR